MKSVILSCVLVAVGMVAAAPAQEPLREKVRQKRSSYGGGGYGGGFSSPCAGAGIPVAGPGPYLNLAPVHAPVFQHAPHGYGYGPHYRTDMDDEMMAFSDMDPAMSEHMMGRSAYPYAAPSAPHYGALAGQSQAGPVFGVFPNANVGSGSVALLLSCTPSVSAGRVVSSQPSSPAAVAVPAGAYRGVDEQHQMAMTSMEQKPEEHEHVPAGHEANHASVHQ